MKKISFLLSFIVILSGCTSTITNLKQDWFNKRAELNRQFSLKKNNILLVSQLSAGEYQAAIENLQSKYDAMQGNIKSERNILWELDYLNNTQDAALSKKIEQFVSIYPNNHLAYLVRGYYFSGEAYRARGSKWSHLTSDEQIANMEKFHKKAIADYEKVLRLSKSNYLSHLGLAEVYRWYSSMKEKEQKHLKAAMRLQPLSHAVWMKYFWSLAPRWGGSYAKMEAAIQEVQPYSKVNPELKSFDSFILYEKGQLAVAERKRAIAREYFEDALKIGELPGTVILLGEIYFLDKSNRFERKGCRLIKQGLELRPYDWSANFYYAQCARRGYVPALI